MSNTDNKMTYKVLAHRVDHHNEILIDSDESEHRLELLHENVKKYGTVFNTVAPGTQLKGVLRRTIQFHQEICLTLIM